MTEDNLSREITRIDVRDLPFEMVCEICRERTAVPYYAVTPSGMALYYCEPCGEELTENNNG